jgi:hypothetical protein
VRARQACVLFALAGLVAGCERGCAWRWLHERGLGGPRAASRSNPGAAVDAIDCPDGLARCVEGSVEVSRLASIAQPCRGPEGACACPWDVVASCDQGCAVEGFEVVVGRAGAAVQLCAAPPGDVVARAPATPDARRSVPMCDEGQLFRCVAGDVVDCALRDVVASCVRGCAEGADAVEDGIGQHPLTREGAFAILCSR